MFVKCNIICVCLFSLYFYFHISYWGLIFRLESAVYKVFPPYDDVWIEINAMFSNRTVIFEIFFPIKNYRGLSPHYRREAVGVCSSYKRGGQPLYNLPAAHFCITGIFPSSHYKQQYHLRPTVGLQGYFPPPNYKHSYELWPTCGKSLLWWPT